VILLLFYTILCSFLVWRFPFWEFDGHPKWHSVLLFWSKIAGGMLVWAVYYYAYGNDRVTSDTFRFFDDGLILYESFFAAPSTFFQVMTGIVWDASAHQALVDQTNNWYKTYNYGIFNDNQTIIRFNALASIFTNANYFANLFIINFLAFSGITLLFRFFRKHTDLKSWVLLLACFFIPQSWLWSSGLLKEALLFFGLGFFLYSFDLLLNRIEWKSVLMFLLGLAVLLTTKIYVLACLMPALVYWAIIRKGKTKHAFSIFLKTHIVLLVLVIGLNASIYPLLENLAGKQMDFIRLGLMSDAGSYFDLSILKPTWMSLIMLSPEALWNSFFRPFWEDSGGAASLMSWFENIAIAGLVLMSLFTLSKLRLKESQMFWFCLSFTLILFILIGTITPVAGALVRYKIPALSFLLIGCLSLSRLKFLHEKN